MTGLVTEDVAIEELCKRLRAVLAVVADPLEVPVLQLFECRGELAKCRGQTGHQVVQAEIGSRVDRPITAGMLVGASDLGALRFKLPRQVAGEEEGELGEMGEDLGRRPFAGRGSDVKPVRRDLPGQA